MKMEENDKKPPVVKLTDQINISNGSHILYTYNDQVKYINNICAFVSQGLDEGDVIILIDYTHIHGEVINQLNERYTKEDLNKIIFIDNVEFYELNGVFNASTIHEHFGEIINPYLASEKTIRAWGHADIQMQDQLLEKLLDYECRCSELIDHFKMITVCAYDGQKIPSYIICELLSAHQYIMTDSKLLPINSQEQVQFPTLHEQLEKEREYKHLKFKHKELQEDSERMKQDFQMLAIQSSKLSETGKLAGSFAHEIKNPLTAIKGFLNLISQNKIDQEKRQSYFQVMSDEIKKIEQITNDLLNLSKPPVENYQENNIIKVINDVVTLLQFHASQKGIEIVHNYEQDEIVLVFDEMKIKQVLINLIKNSIEAMEEGKITCHTSLDDRFVIVSVQDEGCGMPPHVLKQVGNPFFTTKDEGNGLGLSTCFNIIENHGGSIAVESKEDVGTTFAFKIPLSSNRN
ncbi:MEDS domain-containing protein [Bacillaceae bacterium S4-13-58]